MNKDEIILRMNDVTAQFIADCIAIPDEIFFRQPLTKWSIAQNITHLESAAKMTSLAYRLPKFIVKIYGGKPNRPSRSYEDLVAKYKLKLEQGGKASGPYIPKTIPTSTGKSKILERFNKRMQSLSSSILNRWNDAQLDQYLAPHPLLGKITLRELCYFTIYHTLHHDQIIKQRLND